MGLNTDFKQTEAGIIPTTWAVRRFADVATLERGKFTARPRNDPKYYGGEVPFIQTGDVANSDGIIKNYSQTLNLLGLGVSRLFARGTLFFTIAANIGDIAFAGFDAACPDSLVAITPGALVDKKWIFYELKSRKRIFEKLATHNAQLNINLEKLRPYLLPIPPLDEQRAIATALGDVDALIVGLEKLIAKKRNIKQAAMQQLLTGKTRLPGFSAKWQLTKFGDLASLKNGYAFKSQSYTDSGDYKIITIANVQDGYMNMIGCSKISFLPQDIQPHHILNVGDLLISMTGNVGRVCHVPEVGCLLNQRVGKLVPINIDGTLLFQLVLQRQFTFAMSKKAKGGAQGNLSVRDILDFEFNVPNEREEQSAIASVLSDMDAEISALEKRLAKTRDIKQGMMQELLTGKTRLV